MGRTIPPTGLAPTIPPPPPHRARRALFLALLGGVLLALAITWQRHTQPHPGVFAYESSDQVGGFFRRLLVVASGLLELTSLSVAISSLRKSPAASLAALLCCGGWLAALLFTQLR